MYIEALSKLRPIYENGTITAGNASGINDGAAAMLIALDDRNDRINPRGRSIALGHPLRVSGTRIFISTICKIQRTERDLALCTMCMGVGQEIALVVAREEE